MDVCTTERCSGCQGPTRWGADGAGRWPLPDGGTLFRTDRGLEGLGPLP